MWGLACGVWLLLHGALAQAQTFDGHGPTPPARGAAAAPLLSLSGDGLAPVGSVSAGLLAEVASQPLVVDRADGTDVTSSTVLGPLVGANLGVAARPHERVGVHGALPVWLGSSGEAGGGPAPGDLRLDVPVALTPPGRDLALLVVPSAALPTGAGARYLGQQATALGGRVAASGRLEAWSAGVDAGPLVTLGAGADLRAAAHVGRDLSVATARLEAWTHVPLGGGAPAPAEIVLSGAGDAGPRLWWAGGLGFAASAGPGASPLRVYAGVGLRAGGDDEPELRVQAVDAPVAVLRVTDIAGQPVRGAKVRSNRRPLGETDHTGALELGTRPPDWLSIRAEGYVPATLDDLAWAEGSELVKLQRPPVPVVVRVVDPEGNAATAQLELLGPSEPGAPEVDELAAYHWLLPTGTWLLSVQAEGMGMQERVITIDPARTDDVRVDVVLTPDSGDDTRVTVRVVDPAGGAVEDAQVRLGDQPLGTTGPDGTMDVAGVAEGTVEVTARAALLGPGAQPTELVGGTPSDVTVELPWLPGSVRVIARGPEGRATDATIAFRGPAPMAATKLGYDGERVFRLSPGSWSLFASSPALGTQERRFTVDAQPRDARTIEVVFQPFESDAAELYVDVTDPDGRPISGAELLLDDRTLGRTTGGTFAIADLSIGRRTLAVQMEGLRPWTGAVDLQRGPQTHEVTVAWEPGTVEIAASTQEGAPADALVGFSGPEAVPALRLGSDGLERLRLAPGTWDLAISSAEHGTQTRELAIPEDSGRLHRVEATLATVQSGGGALTLAVSGPEGPLEGALVIVDGQSLGTTASGGVLRVQDLAPGTHRVSVSAEAHIGWSRELKVGANTELLAELEWAPGALVVSVTHGGEPVPDALLSVMGARRLPPLVVEGGHRVLGLDPGPWWVLVSSPTLGAVERGVELSPEVTPTREVFELAPPEDAGAVLWLRAMGVDGNPVPDARVVVGSEEGRTSPSGSFLARDLPPGRTRVSIDPPPTHARDSFKLRLEEGSQTHTAILQHIAVPLVVVTRDEGGDPVPASVWFDGALPAAGVTTSASGRQTVELPAGTWSIFAQADGFQTGRQLIEVTPALRDTDVVVLLPAVPEEVVALELEGRISFALDSAELGPGSGAVLDEVAGALLGREEVVVIEVQGHTDDSGGVAYNLDLSERRAEAVVAALVERGVAGEHLVARGYGVLRPLEANRDAESRAKNRRVQFVVLEE